MNQVKLETTVNNLINKHVAEAMLDSGHPQEFWKKIEKTGYLEKEEAMELWRAHCEDQLYRWAERMEATE